MAFFFAVPGPVHNITARARFNLIDISWKPPEKPNGIMTGYDVTYTVRKINTTVSVDLSATYSIPVNLQEEHVPIVTVTPYTRSGPGESASIFDLTTKPIPRKFCIELASVHLHNNIIIRVE